jgi:diamine N-acetyltransferase
VLVELDVGGHLASFGGHSIRHRLAWTIYSLFVAPSDVTFRRAVASDAEALSALAERIFRETFGADSAAADIDLYCLQAYSPALQAAEIASPAIHTIVASDPDAGLVAFAQLRDGPAPAEVAGPAPIEIVRFYVDRPLQGTGVAQRLMEAAVAAARARGAQTLWLAVWERNPRARTFYRKMGFADVGAQTFRLGSDVQTDRVMARAV